MYQSLILISISSPADTHEFGHTLIRLLLRDDIQSEMLEVIRQIHIHFRIITTITIDILPPPHKPQYQRPLLPVQQTPITVRSKLTSTSLRSDSTQLNTHPMSSRFEMLQRMSIPTNPSELLSPTINVPAGQT